MIVNVYIIFTYLSYSSVYIASLVALSPTHILYADRGEGINIFIVWG